MRQILLISDTHGFWDSKLDQLLESTENSSHPLTDEIWHAGDIGSSQIIEKLEKTNKKLRLVSGNIDGVIFKKVLEFLKRRHPILTHTQKIIDDSKNNVPISNFLILHTSRTRSYKYF